MGEGIEKKDGGHRGSRAEGEGLRHCLRGWTPLVPTASTTHLDGQTHRRQDKIGMEGGISIKHVKSWLRS